MDIREIVTSRPVFCEEFYRAETPEQMRAHLASHGVQLVVPTLDHLPTFRELEQMTMAMERTCSGIALFKISEVFHLYNILNLEFVRSLAVWLQRKAKTTRIVEICAGDGLLTHWLRKEGIEVFPVDEDTTAENPYTKSVPKSRVEHLEAMAAMEKYNPEIVLASWIPHGSDIATRCLKYPSVKSLVWIGEMPGGCSGDESIMEFPHRTLYADRFVLSRTDCFLFENRIYRHGACEEFYKEPSNGNA